MAGRDRDVAQGEADPQGPPGHAGGTYGSRDEADLARRSELRDDNAVDAGFQTADRLDFPAAAEGDADAEALDTPDAKAAHDLNY